MPGSREALDELARIKEMLTANPQGMTVTEIAAALRRTKNTVGRYLDTLRAAGQVEMRTCGMAKVYTLAHRVPISRMVSLSRELVMILDRGFRVLQVNDRFLELLRLQRDQVIGRSLLHLPVAEPETEELVKGLASILRGESASEELFLALGEGRWFSTRSARTVFEDGTEGIAIVLIEVTGWRRAEQALAELGRRLHHLLEGIPLPIAILDTQGRVKEANQLCRELLGLAPDEDTGEAIDEKILRPAGMDLREVLRTAVEHPDRPLELEAALDLKDGRRCLYRWTFHPARGEGGAIDGLILSGFELIARRSAGPRRTRGAGG